MIDLALMHPEPQNLTLEVRDPSTLDSWGAALQSANTWWVGAVRKKEKVLAHANLHLGSSSNSFESSNAATSSA